MPLIDVEFALPRVVSQQRTDGTALLQSAHTLGDPSFSMAEVFRRGAASHPERLLASERDGDGWRSIAWGEAELRAGDAALLLADPPSDRVITAPTV
jgi:hypothetical protein